LKLRNEKNTPRGLKSIFARLLIFFILLAVCIAVGGSFTGAAFVGRYVIGTTQRQLLSKAQTIAEMMSRPEGRVQMVAIGRITEIENLFDARYIYIGTDLVARRFPYKRYGADADIPAQAESQDGWHCPEEGETALPEGFANRDFEFYSVKDTLDKELMQRLLDGNSETGMRDLALTGGFVVFAGTPVYDAHGDIIGAILLYRTAKYISSRSREILSMYGAALIPATLLAVALAWYLGRRISKPIVRLHEGAQRMAQGHYGERLPISSRDEIGQLGCALNSLSGELEDVIGRLNAEKAQLDMILSSIGEGIVAIDAQGGLTKVNISALSILGLKCASCLTREGASEDVRRLMAALRTANSRIEKQRLSWTTPTERAVEALISPVRGSETEDSSGAVALIRDVSEARRLEQMRKDYIANISHELRTPLTGIRGMTEPLIDDLLETEEEKRNSYAVIYQETLRLEKLISEMLDMSRLQSGKIEIELEMLEPEPIVHAALTRVRARAKEAGVTLEMEVSRPGITALGNEDRILQVVTILLDNALGFTPSGGTVTAFVHEDTKSAYIGVRDTGCGIELSDLPYIWERFYKADRSRMRTTGTGLGLSIAKLVVELMGGEIGVETEAEVGTTFTFTLRKG
jgi:two-component system sensor histidine kinase ResE